MKGGQGWKADAEAKAEISAASVPFEVMTLLLARARSPCFRLSHNYCE